MPVNILLADDHNILRQGIRALLSNVPDFHIIGEAGDGLEVLKMIEHLQPDVVVLDLAMPGLGGLDVTRQICKQYPDIRVVVLSMHSREAYVLEALKHGASGYVLKGSDASELVLAIRQVMQGAHYLSPPLTERAIQAYMQKTQDQNLDPYETLTNRERQVFHLAAEGLSSTEIGRRLSISARTAEVHRSKALRKLGLRGQTDLIRYALQRGLLPED